MLKKHCPENHVATGTKMVPQGSVKPPAELNEQHGKEQSHVKCISATHLNPVLHRKLCHQRHTGLSLSPYQSHQGGARLDLHLAAKDNLSSFTQRVMSAKLLRVKQLQNQLAEANLQLNELYTENRLLRALQKRQDLALDRYEGAQAQLPQLVRSHHEEVRTLRSKYRNLKVQFREVSKTLKDRETELLTLKEQHNNLLTLSRDRSLGEREALTKQVLELQSTVNNQKNTIQVLNRRVLLETKNLKHQLHLEMQRHKATQSKLQNSYTKMEDLQTQLEQCKERQGIPASMLRSGKSFAQPSTRFPGLRRPTGNASFDKLQQGSDDHSNNKPKYSLHQCNPQNIPPTTDPSSDQPDSSMATFSEKTNEFSTSMDSSPEHALDIISTSDTSSTAPMPTSLVNGSGKSTGILKDDYQTNISNESPKKDGFSSSGDLDAEYKQALEMLSELSAKDRGDYDEKLSCSLSSADEVTAKRVAILANAAFAVKGASRERSASFESRSAILGGIFESHSVPSTKELQNINQNISDSPAKGRRVPSSTGDAPSFKESTFDAPVLEDAKNSKSELLLRQGILDKMPWEEYTPLIPSIDNRKEFSSAKNSFEKAATDESNSPAREEDEDFHKEALLKALKAIDDEAVSHKREGSQSDDSDSGIAKQTSKPVTSGRMFTPINSSGVGVKSGFEPLIKRRPFK